MPLSHSTTDSQPEQDRMIETSLETNIRLVEKKLSDCLKKFFNDGIKVFIVYVYVCTA